MLLRFRIKWPWGHWCFVLLWVAGCLAGVTGQAQGAADSIHHQKEERLDSFFRDRMGYGDSAFSLSWLKEALLHKGEEDLLLLKNHIRPFTFSQKDTVEWKMIASRFRLKDSTDWMKVYKEKLTRPVSGAAAPFLQFTGGYISYNLNYRSRLDSPFTEMGLLQHLVVAGADFTLAGKLPLKMSYYGRETSSPYFRDYRDLRVDIDVERLRQLKTKPALDYIKNRIPDLRNPFVQQALAATRSKLQEYGGLLDNPSLISQYINAKELLSRQHFADTSAGYRDSLKAKAQLFIQCYDSLQGLQGKYRRLYDSLQGVSGEVEAKINRLRQLAERPYLSPAEAVQLATLYRKGDPRMQKLLRAAEGIKTLSLGRTLPHYSNLTLQNLNVNGINVEYNKNNLYLAATAGTVDFRMRDFLFKNEKKLPQYVYLARVGYGSKERDHLILTYFSGKKQLPGSTWQEPAQRVQGLSLATQYWLRKHTRLTAELAQTGMYRNSATGAPEKTAFDFKDDAQRAFSLGVYSWVPATGTRLEGYYQKSGYNYQSFNSFQYSGARNSWSARVEQPFFQRQLSLAVALRKNDFTNPLLSQRFNAQTVYKTVNLTFRKPRWPVISLGYLPSSQQTVIDSGVYENHFHTMTGSFVHQYDLGFARCHTVLMYSRYFNESSDTALLYFNARNVFWQQTFAFRLYTATIGATVMMHHQYRLYVLEEGWSTTLFKKLQLGFGLKINHLSPGTTRLGFKTSTGFSISQVGQFNLWAEESYLPAAQNNLYKYSLYNIGFTRFFK